MRLKIIIVCAGLIALTITACKKQLDINIDPNNPNLEQLTPKLVFPVGVADAAGRIGGHLAILGGMWAQYYTQGTTANQYKDIDSYSVTKTFGSTNRGVDWVELYSGSLNDLTFVINKAAEQQDWNYYLMGTVVRAYTLQVLADLYDKIPYSEAFKGAANLQPKFDDGYSVYKGLLAELDTALNKDFSSSTNTIAGTTDFIFTAPDASWTIEPWKQFANTLKLKMYLRMAYAKPAEAEAGIKAMYAKGVKFLDRDAKMSNFENSSNRSNPFYNYSVVQTNDANVKASVTFLSWLQANNDPRLDNYFYPQTNSTTVYLGINQGDYLNPDPLFNSASKAKITATDPVDFISLSESYFLQAEALERYLNGAGASEKYNAGVSASFSRYNDNAASFIAAGGKYAYPSTGNFEKKLEAIVVQKWAAFPNSHSLESFFEKNRTGYPRTSPVYSTSASYVPGQFVYSKNGITNGLFPKRLIFPDLETSKNPNAPADEPVTAKVWWDVK